MCNSRRQFIKHMGLGALGSFLTPYERFADSIVSAFIEKAYAQETNNMTSKYYVNFFFPSGPHRVVFDQWLRTNAADPALVYNPMSTTAFTKSNNKASGFEYKTFTAANGTLVPHLFSQSVNTSSGPKNLSILLNHMLAIRGFSTGVDGHGLNANLQQVPLAGAPSMLALTADHSSAPYGAVRYRATGPWVSLAGKAVSELNGDKAPLQELFESLRPSATALQKVKTLKERNVAAYERAEAQLKVLSQSDSLGAKTLKASLDNARSILKKGLGDIDGYWNQAVNRYATIINNAARTNNIPGISDVVINPTRENFWRVESGVLPAIDQDLRNCLLQATAPGLPESFALCEYLILGNFTSSMQVLAQPLENLTIQLQENPGQFAPTHKSINADMHFVGAGPSILIMNATYRALLAGVLELKEKLEAKSVGGGLNAWNQTVLHFSGDFARNGRAEGDGSDHGFGQNANSVISGAFNNGPFCVGNIYLGAPGTGYSGTIGSAAPIQNYPVPGAPGMAFAGTHVANILGLTTNPFGNVAPPAARLIGNTLVAGYPGKIVAGG